MATKTLHELPRECLHSAALHRVSARLMEAKLENARLQKFALQLADKIFAAHEVLVRLAEKKGKP